MNKLVLALPIAWSLLAGACQQDNKKMEADIAELKKGQAELLALVKAGGGRGAGAAAQQPRRPQADPSKTYAAAIDGAAFEGPADAKITIVKAYEYACPYCEKVRPTTEELKKKYGNDLRIVYKHYVVHPQVATSTALAACAAHKQGKFSAMEVGLWDQIFKARKFDADRCWTSDAGCPNVEGIAKEIGLDLGKFKADMKGECNAVIQKDQKDLATLGVSATPAFFINGRFLSGAQPLDAFVAVIDEELKKANERIAAGTPAASYYQTWVMEKGLKAVEMPK
ncbi:MAG: thioredoxin domain-containing protein [Kofleriaceae bacterium]|jgi:protein-disulfide isomerase|nr:thioredoxin domain-containing protein [Kofleriaceae bacterium]MBP6838245.1 thioredoxin domain-containing protein [Kofleriaceae bacterium]MBP9204665.1 thioredoxin domain-containing protein [Kofleriaceae bacterium]